MQELVSYAVVPGYETDIWTGGEILDNSLAQYGLDGVELFVWQNEPQVKRVKQTIGAHLNYDPMWFDFYRGDHEKIHRFLPSSKKI